MKNMNSLKAGIAGINNPFSQICISYNHHILFWFHKVFRYRK